MALAKHDTGLYLLVVQCWRHIEIKPLPICHTKWLYLSTFFEKKVLDLKASALPHHQSHLLDRNATLVYMEMKILTVV